MSFAAVLERLAKLENPYPGLRPFESDEGRLFFGRDQQVLDLLDRLARNRFVAVLGLSGSGKSSLVRAGLIPALHSGRLLEPGLRWRVALARPAGAPFANLADALGCNPVDLRKSSHGLIDHVREQLPPGEGLLVVIDQFEELFRYKDLAVESATGPTGKAAAASEAAAFIELLLASTRSPLPIYVVITMRTDYLGDCAEFPEFPEALNDSQYLVPRLTREQRRQAIEGPLGRVRISSALVERILNDAGDEPDQLPILQHALMRTWSRWRDSSAGSERPIETEDYDAVGGFEGALNQHADELLQSPAIQAEPKLVEIIFKRLTARGRGNRERRDPARLSELWELCNASSDERCRSVCAILDVFRQGEGTFLTPRKGKLEPDTYIDIAHESLIRNWKVLSEKWLPEEEKQSKTLIELLDRARGWQAHERNVLTGLDLSGALVWNSQRNRSAKWAEHYAGIGAIDEVEAFLAASQEEFDESERKKLESLERELTTEQKLREAAELRAQVERSSARRTRIFSYVLALLLIGALGLAAIAWRATLRARDQQNVAESATRRAVDQQKLAESATRRALDQQALAESATVRARDQQKLAESGELAAKAETLVSLGKLGEALDSAIHAFSIDKTSQAREAIAHAFPQQLTALEGHSGAVLSAAFSPDGQLVLTASRDDEAGVWNAATGKMIAKLKKHSYKNTASFSSDGQRAVSATGDRTAWVWNVATGEVMVRLDYSVPMTGASFSPDGRRVVTVSVDGTAELWNPATGEMTSELRSAVSAVFSSDGQRIVTASRDHTARVWNANTGQEIAKLEGHSDLVNHAEFSPDGQRVVTASDDHTGRVWNAANGQVVVKLEGHADRVNTAAFSLDGQRVVTASVDHTSRVWNAGNGEVIAKLEGHSGSVLSAVFSPDGLWVVTASVDHTAEVWNAANGHVVAKLEGHSEAVNSAAFSPDGQHVVTASEDHTARVWNAAATGRVIAKLEGHAGPVHTAVFSPNGQHVVTASEDHTARVWNAATGQVIAKLEGHSGPVYSAAFSPDGQRVVTASGDHTARVWNAGNGTLIAKLDHPYMVSSAAFSPDGQHVVTASIDHTARVWNLTTHEVIAKLEGHSHVVISAKFSPDGQQVVTASSDHTARVWNANTGQEIAKLEGHSDLVHHAEFSPDGRSVVTASSDGTARVWNLTTHQVIAKLEGHSGPVYSAKFSPDGWSVVTASSDGTARVWNLTTHQVIAKLEGHSGPVYSAAFSPDGQRVVTAGSDGSALIFRIITPPTSPACSLRNSPDSPRQPA